MRRCVPFADRERPARPARGHCRWYSVDGSLPTRKPTTGARRARRSLNLHRSSEDETALAPMCDPKILVAVARVFGDRIERFSEYERFGGYYELVRADIDQMSTSMATW